MSPTGKLQKDDVVYAALEEIEYTDDGFRFVSSAVVQPGTYDFVPAEGPARRVDVEGTRGPGRPRGKARYR